MLFNQEEISILQAASKAKEVASTANIEHEKAAIARLINLAANTGETRAIWELPICDELKIILEGQGYKVTRKPQTASKNLYEIDWS